MAKKTAKKKQESDGYISKAILREVRVSPRKARLVVDLVRGQDVSSALDILANCDKKTAPMLKKLLMSAVANAESTSKVDIDELFVKRIWVSDGKILRRVIPRAQGRATPIRKRHSTITVMLDEIGAR